MSVQCSESDTYIPFCHILSRVVGFQMPGPEGTQAPPRRSPEPRARASRGSRDWTCHSQASLSGSSESSWRRWPPAMAARPPSPAGGDGDGR